MLNKVVKLNGLEISNNKKITLISGPCQLETEQHAMDMAGKIKEIASKFKIGFIYKTSFDKANRTSLKGKRGAGLDASLPVFDKIKKELNVPILTDIHNIEQCTIVASHVDVLQIPAFLCRQTDLLIAAAKTDKIKLGTGIMQITSRAPSMTAMTCQSMRTVSDNRFILGLGVSGPQVVEGLHGAAVRHRRVPQSERPGRFRLRQAWAGVCRRRRRWLAARRGEDG